MATAIELEKLALSLPEGDRANLATALLGSLAPVLHDGDEGAAEALRRDEELERRSESAITLQDLDRKVAARR
jgi:hypothetical protein